MTTSAPAPSTPSKAIPPAQPDVHELLACVAAPAQWLMARDGRMERGVEGLYLADRRALSQLTVKLAGASLRSIFGGLTSAGAARFVAYARGLGDPTGDPTVTLERTRRVHGDRGVESLTIVNAAQTRLSTTLTLTVAADLAPVSAVRTATASAPLPATPTSTGLTWRSGDGCQAVLTLPSPGAIFADGRLEWRIELAPGETWTTELTVRLADRPTAATAAFRLLPPAPDATTFTVPTVRSADHRFDQWIAQSLADLTALRLADPADPADVYLAAGCPWYLTLFGRDSLWAARMTLPLGHRLAAGTLRALARRQGRAVDPVTEEQPGKIPHELRAADSTSWLPPVYYGTIDATPLFVATLAEAWRWGMPDDEVEHLLPAAERALNWMADHGDADADGFLEYSAPPGVGLANQGWKDSDDGVRYADGRRATAPLALCEAQGYAYEAAAQGARLLDHFGRPGADRWRTWAARLAERFRAAFWIDDPDGAYPAIALDGAKQPVDGPASNMGHLLGTGLLDPHEEALVAARLGAPDMTSGHGLRTLSSRSGGYNPLSYHAGSVWPHDTAIAAYGLHRAGRTDQAADLIAGLMTAAPYFHGRLPELYGGHTAKPGIGPVAYPAACAPQAWAAAAAPLAIHVLLGLHIDLPAVIAESNPPHRSVVPDLSVDGLRIGNRTIATERSGRPT